MILTVDRLAQLARAAGWTGDNVVTAVAIALAESGGDASAVGDVGLRNSTWGPSVGLWQIRSLNAQHGTGGVRDEVANREPSTNARHAHDVWRQSGWGAWSTYTSGSYRGHLATAQQAAQRTAPAAAKPAAPARTTTIVIRPGDTLSALAAKYHTTVAELAALNHIPDPDLIRAGATLHIPA